jgi:hypothetical protein
MALVLTHETRKVLPVVQRAGKGKDRQKRKGKRDERKITCNMDAANLIGYYTSQ